MWRSNRAHQNLTFATGSRTLSESASPPHKWWLSVQWQVSARGDSSIPVGRRASRTWPLRCPSVWVWRRKHRGGGRGERMARNRRRSRRRVFDWHGERTWEEKKITDGHKDKLGTAQERRRREVKIGKQTLAGGEKSDKEGGRRQNTNVEILRIGGRQWVIG